MTTYDDSAPPAEVPAPAGSSAWFAKMVLAAVLVVAGGTTALLLPPGLIGPDTCYSPADGGVCGTAGRLAFLLAPLAGAPLAVLGALFGMFRAHRGNVGWGFAAAAVLLGLWAAASGAGQVP